MVLVVYYSPFKHFKKKLAKTTVFEPFLSKNIPKFNLLVLARFC
jgi:hypothetical protein